MITVGDWKRQLRRFTGMTETDVNDFGLILLNEGRAKVLTAASSYMNEDTYIADTIASQQDYALPVRCHKVNTVTVTTGGIKYTPRIFTNKAQWNIFTAQNSVTGTIPLVVFIDRNRMSFFPTPSANGNQIKVDFLSKEPDLSEEDVTGGTITATNGSATITGLGTTFLASYVGWSIKLPDGLWYEVEEVASTTSLTLTKLYEGATASGATYRLGQVSLIPEDFQMLPVFYAAMMHYLTLEKPEKAAPFTGLWERGIRDLSAIYGSNIDETLITGTERRNTQRDPNDYVAQGINS